MLTAIHVTVDGSRTYERLLLFFTWPFSLILFFSFDAPISFIPQSVVMVSWWLVWNVINLIGRSCPNFCLTHKCGGFSILIRRLWVVYLCYFPAFGQWWRGSSRWRYKQTWWPIRPKKTHGKNQCHSVWEFVWWRTCRDSRAVVRHSSSIGSRYVHLLMQTIVLID